MWASLGLSGGARWAWAGMAGGRRPVAVLAAALLLGVSGASAVAAEAPIGWDWESLPSLAVARGASPASAVPKKVCASARPAKPAAAIASPKRSFIRMFP